MFTYANHPTSRINKVVYMWQSKRTMETKKKSRNEITMDDIVLRIGESVSLNDCKRVVFQMDR